jgi:hypothetical protein
MNITLGKEVVISRAPEEIKDWGPWQFPVLYRCRGRLYLEFNVSNDSAKDYALPRKKYVSTNEGESWEESTDFCGLELENGEIIKPHIKPSLPEEEVALPEKIGSVINYGLELKIYDLAEVDEQYTKWYIDRYSPLTDTISTEEIRVNVPDGVLWVAEGVLPANFLWSFQHGFNGEIWSPLYRLDNRLGYFDALSLRSDDDGKSFETIGRILYEPPYPKDPGSSERLGFTEPSIQFLDEKNGFSILRVTDGTGIAPSYISYTKDGGKSWSRPEYFDDRGVLPKSVLLENGAVLAGYGRPGLYVRPYFDGEWFDRVAVVEPEGYQTETCSYCAIEPISEDTALIVYSKFQYPDERGVLRKTILCRTVKVTP